MWIVRLTFAFIFLFTSPLSAWSLDKLAYYSENWGSAKAVLNWKDRNIPGRVIYEHLIYRNWNRLTRTYAGTWDNFQGFYLVLGGSDTRTWRDLYLRSEGQGNTRRTKGFSRVDGWSGTIHAAQINAYDIAKLKP